MAFPSRSSGGGILPWPPGPVYEALIDYNNWFHWFPSMTASRLLMKEESLAIVELVFATSGGNAPVEETLMMECIHTANRTVLGRVIEGRTPVREIQWDLEAAESECSKVGLSIRRKPGRYLAGPAWWPILNPATCLGGLSSWMEGANPGPETFQGGENLFELWETDSGLVCWVRGQKYKLVPMEDKRS
jgi:hypothetical protein